MANLPIVTFNAGELSPQVDARSDTEKYQAGCRKLDNLIPRIYGSVEKRPGVRYVAKSKYSSGRVWRRKQNISAVLNEPTVTMGHNIRVSEDFNNIGLTLHSPVVQIVNGDGGGGVYKENCAFWFKCDDNEASTNVIDSGINANNGTASVNTSVLYTTGKVDGGFNFDGTSSIAIEVGALSTDSNFSISFWFKMPLSGVSGQSILSIPFKEDELDFGLKITYVRYPYGEEYVLEISNGFGVYYYIFPDSQEDVFQNWTHIVFSHFYLGRSEGGGYLEGIRRFLNSLWSEGEDVTNAVVLVPGTSGAGTLGNNFTGCLDDIRFYNIALTQSQVNTLYNNGAGTDGLLFPVEI